MPLWLCGTTRDMNKTQIAIAVILVLLVAGVTLKIIRKNSLSGYGMRGQNEQMKPQEGTGSGMTGTGDIDNQLQEVEKEMDNLDTNDFGDTQLSNDQLGL